MWEIILELKQLQKAEEGKWSSLGWNEFPFWKTEGECTFRVSVRLVLKQVAVPTQDGEK